MLCGCSLSQCYEPRQHKIAETSSARTTTSKRGDDVNVCGVKRRPCKPYTMGKNMPPRETDNAWLHAGG